MGIIIFQHKLKSGDKRKYERLQLTNLKTFCSHGHIIQKTIDTFCSSENALETFHNEFGTLLTDNIEQQATSYVKEYANNLFKDNFLHKKRNIFTLIVELQNIT